MEKGDLTTAFSGDNKFLKAPLSFNPGTAWEYGIGIDWLGILVEKISDMTLQDYMKKYIFNPLGMIDTSYDVPKEKIERSARNIPNIKVTDVNHFSAFDIVKFKKVVFTESSVKELEKRYS